MVPWLLNNLNVILQDNISISSCTPWNIGFNRNRSRSGQNKSDVSDSIDKSPVVKTRHEISLNYDKCYPIIQNKTSHRAKGSIVVNDKESLSIVFADLNINFIDEYEI